MSWCDRDAFEYLIDHPKYLLGRYGESKNFPGMVFWNTTGNENRADFPTLYFPSDWFKDLGWNIPKMANSK